MHVLEKAWLAICAIIVGISLVVGILTKISFTDCASNNDSLDHLPYLVTPYSVSQIDSDSAFFDFDYRDVGLIMQDADTVISGTFTGERNYSYQAFLSKVRVDKIYKTSSDIVEGTEIGVFEPMSIVDFEEEAVLPQGVYSSGLAPMKRGSNYLFVLDKIDNEIYNQFNPIQKFYFHAENDSGLNPFSRISLGENTTTFVGVNPTVTFGYSSEISIFALDEASLADYLEMREASIRFAEELILPNE